MYRTVTIEDGQTIADIALQEYGTSSTRAMNAVVDDNHKKCKEGIATIFGAGTELKIRNDAPFANKQVLAYFGGKAINSTYAGAPTVEYPDSDKLDGPSGLTRFIIGTADRWRIELSVAWKERDTVFGATVTVLADGQRAEVAISFGSFDNADFMPTLAQGIGAVLEKGHIVLEMDTKEVQALKYKIISAV